MSDCLLAIIASPSMEEELVDWLLVYPDITGFTSQLTNGHGSTHAMSLAEQVTGRRRQIMFWVEIEQSLAKQILEQLSKDFNTRGIHYWIVPLLAAGAL